jgi:hypothetical protein
MTSRRDEIFRDKKFFKILTICNLICSHFPECENSEKLLKLISFWAEKRELEQNLMKVSAHFILLMWNFAQFLINFLPK